MFHKGVELDDEVFDGFMLKLGPCVEFCSFIDGIMANNEVGIKGLNNCSIGAKCVGAQSKKNIICLVTHGVHEQVDLFIFGL